MVRRTSLRLVLAVTILLHGIKSCAALTTRPNLNAKLIVGLNKYSHDASCCIVDSSDGKILFTQAKERLSRYKHDGGAVGDLVNYGLQSIGANIEDIAMVVSNNHHYRVLPFERRLPLYKNIKYTPLDYSDPTNLLPDAQHLELSHHMAHAYSVMATSPFDEGLVLVMDGMGESYKAMFEDIAGIEENSGDYMHDLKLLKSGGAEGFIGQPLSLFPGSGYREAETAYVFRGNRLKPVFKRWTRERSPPELYNHGFENMESMGAVYSRISSHILGDWNACGKIMGLAPWSGKHRKDATEWYFPKSSKKAEKTSAHMNSYRADVSQLGLGDRFYHEMNFMSGNPYDGSFKVNWNELEKLENPNSWSDATFDDHANIAQSVQKNLESCALSLVKSLKDATGQKNIALTGGVALNSVLNGRILKEMGFENTFVPPGPGDEGIAVGCAMYGLQRMREQQEKEAAQQPANGAGNPVVHFQTPFPAYQGKSYTAQEIEDTLLDWTPWIVVKKHESQEELIKAAVEKIDKGEVIAWFQGRSEFGQRALGSRSILADPRNKEMRRYINEQVKEREWYRPLAPSVLDEQAGQWFQELSDGANQSPYMSITATVKGDKCDKIPAVCHIDNTARLQSVKKEDNPLYHALIEAFFKKTGVPMVLNTSFNRKKEPIVESPEDALRALLGCGGHLSTLFMGDYEVALRPFPFSLTSKELSEEESTYFVQAKQFYLSELTSSSRGADYSAGTSGAVRIRIQFGDEAEKDPWTELPSQLHLEVLQLLQDGGSEGQEGEFMGGGQGITLEELYGAMSEVAAIQAQDIDNAEAFEWGKLRDVLKWLFSRGLISFEAPGEGDEVDPADVFKGMAEIVDLRSLG